MTDCIDRDMLLKMISHKPSSPTTDREDRLIDGFISAVKNCPAADVRPVVRGKWILVGTDDMDEGMYKCSECGSEHFFPDILFGIPADNFCSNCGADMREES